MSQIQFRCPHCKAKLVRRVETPIIVEDGQPTLHIKVNEAICSRCTRGFRMIFCAGVELLSEHDVRKDAALFRIAERLRKRLKIPL